MIYELTPKQRVNIISKRLINLKHGAGDYESEQRAREIEKTKTALRRAFRDAGTGALPCGWWGE